MRILENSSVFEKEADKINENINFNDIMLAEEICEKIEKDSRRYKRYLGNDSKAVFL